jgi:hypothetical protein
MVTASSSFFFMAAAVAYCSLMERLEVLLGKADKIVVVGGDETLG